MTDTAIVSHFGFEVGTVRRLLNRRCSRLPRSVVDDAVAKAVNASAQLELRRGHPEVQGAGAARVAARGQWPHLGVGTPTLRRFS